MFFLVWDCVPNVCVAIMVGAGTGLVMASGMDMDHVIANGVLVFVILQIDDSVKDMLNAYGLVQANDYKWPRVSNLKSFVFLSDHPDDSFVLACTPFFWQCTMLAFYLLPFLTGMVAWVWKLQGSECPLLR